MNKPVSDIPLFSAQYANADVGLEPVFARVAKRHWYILGGEVQEFEAEFARYLGVSHCTGVANGTDALELALRALGVGPGDAVVTVANAGFYSSTAILSVGARPIYVDVDSTSMTMSSSALGEALLRKPKAVVVTHLYGSMADVSTLCRIAEEANVPVIEDCAQAHGASQGGRKAGSYGAIGCFSFYPTKNLGAVGDGGAVVTNSSDIDAKLKSLRQYGWSRKYFVEMVGGRNSRLDELQAAVLREKLPYLDRWNEERRSIAQRYSCAFSDLPLQCPETVGSDYVAHLYVVRTTLRDELRHFLANAGISTEVHYPVPDHRQAIISEGAYEPLTVTESICTQVMTLPCFPGLDDAAVERVIAAVREFFSTR